MRHVLVAFVFMSTLAGAQSDIDKQNVVWRSPSKDASGSMPIGNGEVGLNVWVEENGDLLFYVSRTDAWSEASRLMKLGRVRVRIEPNPFVTGKVFLQELVLRDGRISIKAENLDLNLFVDAEKPVIHISGQGISSYKATATLETWRTTRRKLEGMELASSWTMQDAPIPVWESADVLKTDGNAQVLYHRNESTIVPFTLAHQSLNPAGVKDPIKDRTFGLRLEQTNHANGFTIAIAAESLQTKDAETFEKALKTRISESKISDAAPRTVRWWNAFWDRSHIFVEGDATPSLPVTKHKLRVGFDSTNGNRFEGQLRNAVVYDWRLTATELKNLPTNQPENPILNASNTGRKRLLSKKLDESKDAGHFSESEEAAPFDLRRGFTVAALITPTKPVGRIFDMLTAGQDDGFLFDTYPNYGLRAIVGDRQLSIPNALKEGESAHVALTVSSRGGIAIYKNGQLLREIPDDPIDSRITQAYTLQRYIQACGGRGNYPIKFNGSIFTVEPTFLGQDFNPDWRRWGDCYWWQNTRLPYYAMPSAGDFDLMLPLFKMYEDVRPLSVARAQSYYKANGVYFPETMTMFGAYANKDYGWDRKGLEPGNVQCPWWMYAWNQSLELLDLMLDYQAPDAKAQEEFDKKRLDPMARSAMGYFMTRFPNENNVIKLTPTQSVETYWFDVINDTPTVAGLHKVRERIIDRFAGREVPTGWKPAGSGVIAGSNLSPNFPPVPVRNGKIAPAESYKDQRNNVENPEFYAIWPFRMYGVGRGNEAIARKTFEERIEKANAGWQYDGQVAALSGLTDEAARTLQSKVRNSNSAFRWPASWGPNYDWLPDQCHGANIMITLQTMCLQEVGDKLYVLPAFPKTWNVKFKLHASRGTVVTAEYQNGKLARVDVSPKSRTKDLVLPK